MTELLEHLDRKRREGRKLLVPYLMAGSPDVGSFSEAVGAISQMADAVEVGIPFSDPLMDGPVIASAGERALRNGIGPAAALDLVASCRAAEAPRIVMTYYNPIHRIGETEFCKRVAAAGVAGLIVPDLPLEESSALRSAAADHEIAWIPLVAPTSSRERVVALASTCTGFIYAVSSLGVTGLRASFSERAAAVSAACREASDRPVLVGIGVSSADHAVEATGIADGVVVGSAVVAALADEGVPAAVEFVRSLRSALDGAATSA